jgi:rhodanese-related sulfurtransferase
MNSKLFKASFTIGIIILLFGSIIGSTVIAINIRNRQEVNFESNEIDTLISSGYTDITVEEAWDLLASTENGIQIPIDVRGFQSWWIERIDTPYPEDPKQHNDFGEDGVQEFMSLYEGEEVVLTCLSGGRSSSAAKILVANEFNGTIYNMLGGITAWKEGGYPTKNFNDPPNQPNDPSGPTVGAIGVLYHFYAMATDSDDDSVRYGWDWDGDSFVDEWTSYHLAGTQVNMSHIWNTPNIYNVTVMAEDNVGEQSDFSSILTVIITTPPNPPVIDGPSNGNPGDEYEYTFSAIDPNEDNVYYYIDWDDDHVDEWIGAYASGEEVKLKHIFLEEETYEIRVKAKDIYNAESEWTTLETSMPKDKVMNNPQSFTFLQELRSIISYILGLF